VLGIVGERREPGPAHSRCGGGDDDQPDGARTGRRGVPSHNYEVVGDAGVGDEQLRPVDHHGLALDHGGRGQGIGR
jgi:hypothetical protein